MPDNFILPKSDDFISFSRKKIDYFKNLIHTTIQSFNKFRDLEIITTSEVNICVKKIETIYEKCKAVEELLTQDSLNKDNILDKLQEINNDFFLLLKLYGTSSVSDILKIAFGSDFEESVLDIPNYHLVKEYMTPFNFRILPWKNKMNPNSKSEKTHIKKNKIIEDYVIIEEADTCECFDLARTSKQFKVRIDGLKIIFHNYEEKKTLIISGLVENVMLHCLDNEYIQTKRNNLYQMGLKPENFFDENDFSNFVECLQLKDFLIFSTTELCNKFVGYRNQVDLMKQKQVSQIVKEFLTDDMYTQRSTLIKLLIHNRDAETQYLSYLFYDLLSNDDKGIVDSKEQNLIYNSLPWNLKKSFREAMKLTIEYTKSISNVENAKIPLEQQICLMKVKDSVKEKAMNKLKEVKAKSEDSGSKARQYLEGLLKIPFGVYKKEQCLLEQKNAYDCLRIIVSDYDLYEPLGIQKSDLEDLTITSFKAIKEKLYDTCIADMTTNKVDKVKGYLQGSKRVELLKSIHSINNYIKHRHLKRKRLIHSGKKCEYLQEEINGFVDWLNENSWLDDFILYNKLPVEQDISLLGAYNILEETWSKVKENMLRVRETLDASVYGHEKAKRQIERIVGQWMSGEQKGYCFGFEGPPGIGKTSIAKRGLAECLKDSDGNSRPFGFVAVGGSSNGSTLDGHNYTYVGSTWGRIVDILMESKCMNPIIFIDELDKVSRTEHGKEIIGILTHLVDPTQNDGFHDKYFNGIDLDLSKALFIFSYNDVGLLDRILLDRIHRVKFDHLSVKDKLVVTKDHIFPEIYGKINLKDAIVWDDEVITFIIETYTLESGVRKLKEILFEIISEINLEILREEDQGVEYPIVMTKELVRTKYLKERHEVKPKKIHSDAEVGTINGLWANALGQGGIIPIQTTYFPTSTFLDLKLTGMQGDVMKESMNVAKSLAYKMTPVNRQKALMKAFKDTNMQGIHIHCPEGAVPKDGPSAGTAITTCIYSLLNKKKIKHNIAITGEINLQGFVTAIGGLNLKILGGIKAGVKEFIYPEENEKAFKDFYEDYKNDPVLDGITFHQVSHIDEVMKLVFV